MSSNPDMVPTGRRVVGIIAAAGSGQRFGGELPKAFVELDGLSLLTRSALLLSSVCETIVVAAPADFLEAAAGLLSEVDVDIVVIPGGSSRQESVSAALKYVDPETDFVLVHDAARALVPQHVCDSVVQALVDGAPAVIPVLPVIDTIRRVDVRGACIETIDRSSLRRVQTPQGFWRETLIAAHLDPTQNATDDAGLVEHMGIAITTVNGDERSIKVTTRDDLLIAHAFLGES